MNPQETQSTYSSVIVFFLGVAASALVTKGIMTQDQANALVPELGTVVVTIASIALVWWKKNQHTPAAIVAAVNSDTVPGVKAVSAASPSPQVIIDPKGNVRPDPTASLPK